MVQDLKRATFSNIEHQSIDFVVHTLDPWLRRIEKAIVKDVLLEDEQEEYFPQFNVDGLLRGDYKSRMEGNNIARQGGWMSANDIRRLENLDPIPASEGGDLYIINGTCVELKNCGAAYRDRQGETETADQEQPGDDAADETGGNPNEEPDERPKEEQAENKRHAERKAKRRAARR